MTSGSALGKVVNAGEGEGGLAWRSITNRWEPKLRTRQAGVLLGLLKWNFDGDILSRLEAFEREAS
eukprot:8904139-Karenia_brevis.AAC.1